jgi:hypothetical protein
MLARGDSKESGTPGTTRTRNLLIRSLALVVRQCSPRIGAADFRAPPFAFGRAGGSNRGGKARASAANAKICTLRGALGLMAGETVGGPSTVPSP